MPMFASRRAYRYAKHRQEFRPSWFGLDEAMETGFYEVVPLDGTEYPMDRVLEGLMEMHRAGLWRNDTGTGPGNLVDSSIVHMLGLLKVARLLDDQSPKGTYDGILNMDDARVEVRRRGRT